MSEAVSKFCDNINDFLKKGLIFMYLHATLILFSFIKMRQNSKLALDRNVYDTPTPFILDTSNMYFGK